jgi:uncharacterized protein (DUF2252 family)
VEVVEAAYWMKGCSSLGRLRYAVLLGIGEKKESDGKRLRCPVKRCVQCQRRMTTTSQTIVGTSEGVRLGKSAASIFAPAALKV